jgi:serine/threonine-protein kinase
VNDVAAAREQLQHTLQGAITAARQHATVFAAIGLEEAAAWDALAERLIPRLERGILHEVGAVIGEPGLVDMVAARDAAVASAQTRQQELLDAVLDAADFDAITARCDAVDARLGDMRTTLKELRARPGLLALVAAAEKGQRLKEEQARAVRLHDELHGVVAGLEAEASRLSAITARHHRAKRDLTNATEDVRAIDDRFLADARAVVVAGLSRGGSSSNDPQRTWSSGLALQGVDDVLKAAQAAAARQTVLTVLYESWVRPHGQTLMLLEQEAAANRVSGFETISWPPKIQLACREANAAVDAYRRAAQHIGAFQERTANDWWSALAPDVPRPADEVFIGLGLKPLPPPSLAAVPAPVRLAGAASDKLAAAWAQVQGAASATANDGADDGAYIGGDLGIGETEVLDMLPRAPAVAVATNASIGLSSAEFEAIFEDVRDSHDVDVFTNALSIGSAMTGPDPFQHRPSEVLQRPHLQLSHAARPSFLPGSRVGHCVVQGLIGKGGMGEVYRARLEGEYGFARSVVLKRLNLDRVDDDSLLKAFVREAEVAARIAHPNVVQIFDLQSHGGEPYIIMEYLEGLSLQKLATRAWKAGLGLDADVLIRCALDAARGLHAAHTMRGDDGELVGLVHRDVSPDNLFLCSNGFTKLLDFGIARRSDLTAMTGKNELKGKIPYMSPEQILGDDLDARSDLFSLGSTLYFLLTGERPFAGDNEVTTLYAVVNKPHRPLRDIRPDAMALCDVAESLMQKARDDRPSSALEVIAALEAAGAASAEEAAGFLHQVEEL